MSLRHLKSALESYDEQGQGSETIELKGPLSAVYSQALGEVFKRDVPGNDPNEPLNVSEETAANDELMLRELAQSLVSAENPATGESTVLYGVARSEVSPTDVVNVARQYEENPETPVVVVIDGTDAGPNSPDDSEPALKIKQLEFAMESIAKASGGGVYTSLTEYARHHGKKRGETGQRKVSLSKKAYGVKK